MCGSNDLARSILILHDYCSVVVHRLFNHKSISIQNTHISKLINNCPIIGIRNRNPNYEVKMIIRVYKHCNLMVLKNNCWTTTNRSSLPSEYRQTMRSSICLTFIGFRRCTKIHINIDSLRVHQSVRPSLCPFYSQNCLHILSKVSRSTARQLTLGVGSIRCGSSKIQKSY